MAEGLFLGRGVDPKSGKTGAGPLLLDPSDLTTHGLIVGMTGSGKTALGIVVMEELLRKGVPVLAIDPKGDLGNLLLDFPALSPEEFAPWIDASSGATAEGEAKRWSDGLAGWGLGAADVAALASSREAVLYTPGSKAGVPLDLLGSCPKPTSGDEEDHGDVRAAFVQGVLGLAGIEADPVRSREFILLSMAVDALWESSGSASLEGLVGIVAAPPFSKVGALPLESFYPSKERQELVFALNNLLASPASASFRSGVPLDLDAMLGGARSGKTRLSIVSIAHLGDAERLFVVATLLSRVKAWMRTRPGRSSLAALVYIDEIFGFFPPTENPPTKKPLLTLLKQARAFGVGVLLATQNPVDLDYKGLANCGCWFIGTLQAERDRLRLEEGLRAASGSDEALRLLDKTRKRVFLLHDVHRKAPELMETRWAMSYLRGPMTREEILKASSLTGAAAVAASAAPAAGAREAPAGGPPPLPGSWSARWVEKRHAEIAAPQLFVRYAVRYRVGKSIAAESEGVKLFSLNVDSPGAALEEESDSIAADQLLAEAPRRPLRYESLPGWLGARSVAAVEKAVRDRLPDKLAVTLLRDPVTGALSGPGEERQAFAARLATGGNAPRALLEKLDRKRQALAAAEAQEKNRQLETYASMAGAAMDVLGGFLGRKKSLRVGKVGTVLGKRRMENAAESKVETLRAEVQELESQLTPADPDRFESVEVVPAKTHVDILAVGVAWVV